MKKIVLVSLITIVFISNLISQIISVKKPPIDIYKLPAFYGCGFSTVSDINNNSYKTVQIGKQCWMQSNLKVSKYRNGAAIPTGLIDGAWANTTSGAYAIIDNVNANDAIYGKLYNWWAVKDGRGICPTGWHVPSDAEWTTLTTYLGGEGVAGGKMKSTGIAYWNSPNEGATNVSGFSVLPGGCRLSDGSFLYIRNAAFFWSATELASNGAYSRTLDANLGGVFNGHSSSSIGGFRSVGGSVRCLRD